MGSPATGWKLVITCKLVWSWRHLLEIQGLGPGTWNLAYLFYREKDIVPPPGQAIQPSP